jgi:hypothetical protein
MGFHVIWHWGTLAKMLNMSCSIRLMLTIEFILTNGKAILGDTESDYLGQMRSMVLWRIIMLLLYPLPVKIGQSLKKMLNFRRSKFESGKIFWKTG